MNSFDEEKDYLDRLTDFFPFDRPLTIVERLAIALIASTFLTSVVCLLFCVLHPQSAFRRRRSSNAMSERFRLMNVAHRLELVNDCSPPRYESIVDLKPMNESPNLHFHRKSSNATTSDSDGFQSQTASERDSSINRNGFPFFRTNNIDRSKPTDNFRLKLNFDSTNDSLIIRVVDIESIRTRPTFDEHAEYFLHFQLIDEKLWKKLEEFQRKPRKILPIGQWFDQQRRSVKIERRNPDEHFHCDEEIHLDFNGKELRSMVLRTSIVVMDRTNLSDCLSSLLVHLNPSAKGPYEKLIEINEFPTIVLAEIFVGIGYLPTSERLTLRLNKFRCFYTADTQYNRLNTHLIVTLFHHRRRFFQRKFSSILSDSLNANDRRSSSDIFQLDQSLTENVPINNIQSVSVHFQLVIENISMKTKFPPINPSFILGKDSRYASEWSKLIDQPRKIHFAWHQFSN